MAKFRVGIVGCGAISGAYLTHAKNYPILEMAACADLMPDRAEARAKEFGVPNACTVDELLKDDGIDVVLNLTIPGAHFEIAMKAIEAGKHVHNEKPLALDREQGRQLVEAADKAGVRVGGAPDTFFGAGHQTARRLIDEGVIGRPVAATAYMMGRGHEGWHPDPAFYYKPGGGPMFDMGPYYLTQLINLFGRIRRVCGFASIAIPERTIGSKPKFGQKIQVETPDHVAGTIEFENGVITTIIMSFAVMHAHTASPITVYGTEGTLYNPDPNGFDGEVKYRGASDEDWQTAAFEHHTGYGRIVGVADMAHAVRSGRGHRASGALTFGVLDAMQGFLDASTTGQAASTVAEYDRPAALPTDLKMGEFEE